MNTLIKIIYGCAIVALSFAFLKIHERKIKCIAGKEKHLATCK